MRSECRVHLPFMFLIRAGCIFTFAVKVGQVPDPQG
jgi:hypothetical protein